MLRHHALVADLKSFVEGVLLLLKSADSALELVDGGGVGLLALFQLFFELLLKLLKNRVVVVLVLRLALVLRSLKLIYSLLELAKSILVVLFGLLFLLLEELELAFPKSLFFLKLTLKVSMLPLHLVVLRFPVLNLLPDSKLTLRKGLVKLLVLLL